MCLYVLRIQSYKYFTARQRDPNVDNNILLRVILAHKNVRKTKFVCFFRPFSLNVCLTKILKSFIVSQKYTILTDYNSCDGRQSKRFQNVKKIH